MRTSGRLIYFSKEEREAAEKLAAGCGQNLELLFWTTWNSGSK